MIYGIKQILPLQKMLLLILWIILEMDLIWEVAGLVVGILLQLASTLQQERVSYSGIVQLVRITSMLQL